MQMSDKLIPTRRSFLRAIAAAIPATMLPYHCGPESIQIIAADATLEFSLARILTHFTVSGVAGEQQSAWFTAYQCLSVDGSPRRIMRSCQEHSSGRFLVELGPYADDMPTLYVNAANPPSSVRPNYVLLPDLP